jgi:hypothetical protein
MTKPCGQIRTQLLEHLYGLLEEQDGRALTDHVSDCPTCQAELTRAREQMVLIAAAAKEEFPNVRFVPPIAEPALAQPLMATRRIRSVGFRWAVAAAVLLTVGALGTCGSIYWHRQTQVAQAESNLQQAKDELAQAETLRSRIIDESTQIKNDFRKQVDQADQEARDAQNALVQLGRDHQQKVKQTFADVNAKQMDLTVIGPRTIEPGAANPFQVLTKTLRQEPMPARISVMVRDQNQREVFKQENVLSQGNLVVNLPRDLALKPDTALTLEVRARGDQNRQVELSETIPLAGPIYVTHLVTDKPLYRPGETVRFRSLTLERFSLRPAGEDLELIYSLTSLTGAKTTILKGLSQVVLAAEHKTGDAEAPRAPHSILGPDQNPVRGLGAGEFVIDPQAPPGEYTLTVSEGQQRFPPQERKLLILRPGASPPKDESKVHSSPIDAKKVTVEFFPEGGDLVAGVPNRVYFQSRTTSNKPADLKGRIVDDAGKEIARVAKVTDPAHSEANQGMGVLEFTPQLGKKYRLKIDTPAGVEGQHVLPAVKAEGVVMRIPKGVTTDKEPIRVTIRNVGADRSLLVGAYCRGRLMGHQTVDMKKDEVKEVELGPEKGVGGVYRVTVFERVREQAQGERLVPRAERLIYRGSANQLHLAIRPDKPNYAPGEPVHIGIRATNEKDQPQPAIVMIGVVDPTLVKLADEKTYRSMPAHFLLTTEVRRPEDLEHADFLLSADPQAAKFLDLLLGTQGWRRFAEQDPAKFQKEQTEDARRLLALEGQSPPRIVNYGQEAVRKVVKEFETRYAELDKQLTRAEDRQVLVRKSNAQQEKMKRLREEANREETERIAAVSRMRDTQDSLTVAADRLQDFRLLLRDRILPIMICVFLLATAVNLLLARARAWHSRPVPYLAAAAGSLALVALLLVGRANFLPVVTSDNTIEIVDLSPIDDTIVRIDPVGGVGGQEIRKELQGNPPHPANPFIGGLQPNVPRPPDKKEKQGVTKAERREMPVIPLHPTPAQDDQQQAVAPEQPRQRDRRQLVPQMPAPPPPAFVVREYVHLHNRPGNNVGSDFAETLYWHPVIVLPDGNAEVTFDLCDSVSTYQILIVGHTVDGRLAETTTGLTVRKPPAAPKNQDH